MRDITDSDHPLFQTCMSLFTDLRNVDCGAVLELLNTDMLDVLWHHLTPIKAAATHESETVFRVALETTIAECSVVIDELNSQAIHIFGQSPDCVNTNPFLALTTHLRLSRFMAHALAQSPEHLVSRWNLTTSRSQSVSHNLAQLLGYTLHGSAITLSPHITMNFVSPRHTHLLITRDLQRRAILALPTRFDLHLALAQPLQGFLTQNFPAWTRTLDTTASTRFIIPAWEGHGQTFVHTDEHGVNFVFPIDPSEHLAFHALHTEWSPPNIKWTDPAPEFHVTRIPLRAAVWFEKIPYMNLTTIAIIKGQFRIPKLLRNTPPAALPNLHTVQLDPAFIRNIIAKYMVEGVVERCSPSAPPHNLSPLSLVPKDSVTTPWRLVTDLRFQNERVRPQKSSLPTLVRARHLWTPGAFVSALDVSQAYHAANLAGCRGGLRRNQLPNSDGSFGYHIGCLPDDCLGSCDKANLGFQFEGHYYRYAAAVFGGRNSNCSLAALTNPIARVWRSQGKRVILYIDDAGFITPNSCSEPRFCHGPSQCTACQSTLQQSTQTHSDARNLLQELGFVLSDKDMLPCQQGTFLGISFCTRTSTWGIPERKLVKLTTELAQVTSNTHPSRRELAKVVGKLTWYSLCLPHVSILTRELHAHIGNPTLPADWDRPDAKTPGAEEELLFWNANLAEFATQRYPMHPLTAARAQQLWDSQSPLIHAALYTDASYMGFGARLVPANKDTAIEISRTFPAELQLEHQVHREAWAVLLTIQLLLDELSSLTIIHFTDCLSLQFIFAKGTKASSPLLHVAKQLARTLALHHITMVTVWTPGECMLENGTDTLSRDMTVDTHDYSMPAHPLTLLLPYFPVLPPFTIDWFASPSHTLAQRFWTRTWYREAEGCDAFQALTWNLVPCRCGQKHAPFSYFFPPPALLNTFWNRLHDTPVSGVICTPYTPGELWWPTLLERAVPPSPVRIPITNSSMPYKEYALTVVGSVVPETCPLFLLPPPPSRQMRALSSTEQQHQLYTLHQLDPTPHSDYVDFI